MFKPLEEFLPGYASKIADVQYFWTNEPSRRAFFENFNSWMNSVTKISPQIICFGNNQECTFQGITLYGGELAEEYYRIQEKQFSKISFNYGFFHKCIFINCNFTNCSFDFTGFIDCGFEQCTFRNVSFKGITNQACIFKNCKFILSTSFSNSKFDGNTFKDCIFGRNPFCNCYFDRDTDFSKIKIWYPQNKKTNKELENKQIFKLYKEIKEGFLASASIEKARKYYFKEEESFTKYNADERFNFISRTINQKLTGYGTKPLNTFLVILSVLFISAYILYRSSNIHSGIFQDILNSALLSCGGFFTYGSAFLPANFSLNDFGKIIFILNSIFEVFLNGLFLITLVDFWSFGRMQ